MVDVPLFSAHLAHRLLADSPLHAITPSEEVSEGMDLGAVAHTVVLGAGDAIVVVEAPDWRTKAAKEARDAARLHGQTPILAHKWATVERMAARIQEQCRDVEPPIPFTNGVAENSIFWEEDGIPCRATPDWLHNGYQTIDDLKTTAGSAHPAIFSRTLWDKGYDLQAALYRRAVKRVYGVEAEFRFIVCETEPPYALSVVALDPEATAFSDLRLDRALAIWRHCLETGEWPAYTTRTCFAEVPAYLLTQWTERTYYEVTA